MAVYTGEPLIKDTSGRRLLAVASRRLPETSSLAILGRVIGETRLYWRFDASSPTYAGIGTTAELSATGDHRFEQIREQHHDLFAGAVLDDSIPTPARPRVFGGFAYNSTALEATDIWSAFPAALFILPRYQISAFDGQTWLTTNLLVEQENLPHVYDLLQAELDRFVVGMREDHDPHSDTPSGLEVDYPVGHDRWMAMVSEAVGRIRGGQLEKVVLARAAEVNATQPIDPIRILTALDERYPECYRFLIEPEPGHAFFGATPELLANIDGWQIRTDALAGSLRRGATPEEDKSLGQRLLADPKERHEHALVVQDIEQRLAPLTSNLEVAGEPSLRTLRNIQHLYTPISARLTAGVDALHVVEAMHPTPALGGTPRQQALDLIAELEPHPRGWYGAPVGWLDGEGNGQFAVAIRSAVSAGNNARLYAGAGIVADSIPEREWQETALKFRPMMDILSPQSDSNKEDHSNRAEAAR
jgi:menaquinone-specific isochorismate synthase